MKEATKDRIITIAIGLFMAFGSIGGLEQGTMNFGQAVVMVLIGAVLICLGAKADLEGEEGQQE